MSKIITYVKVSNPIYDDVKRIYNCQISTCHWTSVLNWILQINHNGKRAPWNTPTTITTNTGFTPTIWLWPCWQGWDTRTRLHKQFHTNPLSHNTQRNWDSFGGPILFPILFLKLLGHQFLKLLLNGFKTLTVKGKIVGKRGPAFNWHIIQDASSPNTLDDRTRVSDAKGSTILVKLKFTADWRSRASEEKWRWCRCRCRWRGRRCRHPAAIDQVAIHYTLFTWSFENSRMNVGLISTNIQYQPHHKLMCFKTVATIAVRMQFPSLSTGDWLAQQISSSFSCLLAAKVRAGVHKHNYANASRRAGSNSFQTVNRAKQKQ